MRTSFRHRLFAAVCIVAASARIASACQCGGGFHGRNDWENAKEEAQPSTAIFEGMPVHFEVKWKLLDAKDGDLIPAELYSGANLPTMIVTFQVQWTYKGNLGPEVQIHTGVGGGDCAAIYATGLNYLIFAGGPSPDQLGASMCSPGGWVGADKVGTELRYLRKEHPIARDIAPNRPWWPKSNASEMEERWKRDAEERRKRYDGATGRICGTVTHPHFNGEYRGTIEFLSTQGYYPAAYPDSSINDDGAFCSPDLGPGRYYLYFVRGSTHGLDTALYYPGVADVARATAIEVTANQTISNVMFKVEPQSTYSVRGLVSLDALPDFLSSPTGGDVTVLLIRAEGGRPAWYSEKAKFILPKLAYFKFDDVVPGHYAACALAPASGWMTKKADLTVTTQMKVISLDLLKKK
jgi:hypothetical protein